jgi:murein DD-endopeptidase MepM/ murein hydrolase activator NlpD
MRMELEWRFLKAANRRGRQFQEQWAVTRAKILRVSRQLYEKLDGAQRVFSAHAILLAYHKRRLITTCIVLFFAVPITSGILTANYTVYEYSYHGRVLGVVKNVEELQSAIRMIEGTIVEDAGKKAEVSIKVLETSAPSLTPLSPDSADKSQGIRAAGGSSQLVLDVAVPVDSNQAIEIKKSLLPLTETLGKTDTEEEVIHNIVGQSDIEVKAYKIAINGVTLGVVGTREDADVVLARIKAYWLENADISQMKEIGFAEEVSVDEIPSTLLAVDLADDLYKRAFEHVVTPKTYTIGEGETILDVALNSGVTEQQIYIWNPNIDPDALAVGDTLIMEEPHALLNVRTVEEGYYTTVIDFETIYEDTNEFFSGEEEIVTPGVPGTKNAYGEIIRVNGEIVEYIEQSSVVVEEAVSAVIKRGTKPIPPSIGTGTFIVPIDGLVTSLYGPRWGRVHEGIDFGAPVGTTVRAADGGKVTEVGWDGGFGLSVMIDHGAGFSTLYAHLSEALVEAGEDVYQGEQIATSGNTGFSTGPHLHFGIYKFGNAQSPSDYLPSDMPTYLLGGIQLD